MRGLGITKAQSIYQKYSHSMVVCTFLPGGAKAALVIAWRGPSGSLKSSTTFLAMALRSSASKLSIF